MESGNLDRPEPLWRRLTGLGRAAGGFVFDLALPAVCMACHRPVASEGSLCVPCWGQVAFIERPFCERLGLPLAVDLGEGALSPQAMARPPAFDRARAAMRFDGVGRRLVHRLKYGDRPDLAPAMARWMARAGRDVLAEADLIVPVPLHWSRLVRRRYNQAAELARALSVETGISYAPDLLRRVRATRPQVGLTSDQRGENLQGALWVDPERRAEIAGRAVVLVDDVMTTGSTLNAAARALRRAGAARVDAVVAAVVAETLYDHM